MTPRSLMYSPLRVRRRIQNKRRRNRNKYRKLIKHKRIKPKDRRKRYKPILCNFIDIPQDCTSKGYQCTFDALFDNYSHTIIKVILTTTTPDLLR